MSGKLYNILTIIYRMDFNNLLPAIQSIESGFISNPDEYSDDVKAFFMTANISNYKSTDQFKILGKVYYKEENDSFIHKDSIIMSFINNTLKEDLISLNGQEATHAVRLISQDKLNEDEHPFISEPESQLILLYDVDNKHSNNINHLIYNPR